MFHTRDALPCEHLSISRHLLRPLHSFLLTLSLPLGAPHPPSSSALINETKLEKIIYRKIYGSLLWNIGPIEFIKSAVSQHTIIRIRSYISIDSSPCNLYFIIQIIDSTENKTLVTRHVISAQIKDCITRREVPGSIPELWWLLGTCLFFSSSAPKKRKKKKESHLNIHQNYPISNEFFFLYK